MQTSPRQKRTFQATIIGLCSFLLVSLMLARLAHAAPGDLDPTFGRNGVTVTRMGYGYDVAYTSFVVRQPDGKLVMGNGRTLLRATSAGLLDTTFGDAGFVTVLPKINALAVQTDGKLLVAGALFQAGLTTVSDFVLARYTVDGGLDAGFAKAGQLLIPHEFALFVQPYALALQPDGKIVVLGNLPRTAHDDYGTPAVMRLLPNGAWDPTFGEAGKVFIDDRYLFTLTLQPDGKILVGGNAGGGTEATQAVILRLNLDGSPDTTFDGDGELLSQFGADINDVSAMVVQPDGKIVAAVTATYGLIQIDNFEIVRLQPNGALDESFGNRGRATVDFTGESDYANALTLLPDGKLLVDGTVTNGDLPGFARLLANGGLDPSFGDGGKLIVPVGDTPFRGFNHLVQPDGTIVLPGALDDLHLSLRRLQSAGAPDPTFGSAGALTASPGNSEIYALAVQPDGKIVAGGYTAFNAHASLTDWTLTRYNPDGALDPSFDGDGQLITRFDPELRSSWVKGLALQPDGKIVAVGKAFFRDAGWFGLDGLGVARYNGDGTLDSTFAEGGKRSEWLDLDLTETAAPLVIQPDGKLVVVGTSQDEGTGRDVFTAVRLLSNGALDPTFAGDGKATILFAGDANPRAVALQSDGKVVIAGRAHDAANLTYAFGVARLNADGSVDPTFAEDGWVLTGFTQSEGAYALAIQPDGKILVGGEAQGESDDSNADFTLLRYQVNGALDPSFDGDGKVFTGFAPASLEGIRSLAVQLDGKIVATGSTSDWYNRNFAVVRYNADGSLDLSFSRDGKTTTDLGAPNDKANTLAIQADGKVLVAGADYYTAALTRYRIDGSAPRFAINADSVTTRQNIEVTIAVLANDVGEALDTGQLTIAESPTHGAAWVASNNPFIHYLPAFNFTGTDRFTYRACDGTEICATATVTVTILADAGERNYHSYLPLLKVTR